MPFKLSDKTKVIIIFNYKIVYESTSKKLKLNNFEDKEIIHPIVVIEDENVVYQLDTKQSFLFSSKDMVYYLSFYPSNSNEDKFSIIPSQTILL